MPSRDHQPPPALGRGTSGGGHRGRPDPHGRGGRRSGGPRRGFPAWSGEGLMPAGPKRRVVVIFGGRSAEHEVSVVSARSVVDAVDPDRYDVLLIGIDKVGRWHRLSELPSRQPGVLPAVTEESGPGVGLARDPGESAIVSET